MWFRLLQHTEERGVKFTALLVCCNHPQKYTTLVVTSFDTHDFQSSHLSLIPYIDTPLSLSLSLPLSSITLVACSLDCFFGFSSSSCGSYSGLSLLPEVLWGNSSTMDPLTGSVLVRVCSSWLGKTPCQGAVNLSPSPLLSTTQRRPLLLSMPLKFPLTDHTI